MMRTASVSAATGEGMDELFEAIADGAREWHTEYKPMLEEKRAALAAASAQDKQAHLAKLRADLGIPGAPAASESMAVGVAAAPPAVTTVPLDAAAQELAAAAAATASTAAAGGAAGVAARAPATPAASES